MPNIVASPTSQLCRFFPFLQSIRPAQEKALAAIARAYSSGKRFVLLELPTGTGKSAIAMAAAQWASSWGDGAYILSPQKALTAQYMCDFAADGLVELRGRASYRCEDFQTNCDIGAALRRKTFGACEGCPYRLAKEEFVAQTVGVTNFDYFLAETLYAKQLPRRSMIIIGRRFWASRILRFHPSPCSGIPWRFPRLRMQTFEAHRHGSVNR